MILVNCLLASFVISSSLTWSYSLTDHHKLLLISFDALRWDYVDRRPGLEGFRNLREKGVKAEYLTPPFPSLTSPSHTTMATGLYVESHGVVHNIYFNRSKSDEVRDDFFGTLKINEWWDNGKEPIWITASSQGLKSGGYLFPGSNTTIGGRAASRSILQKEEAPNEESDWRQRINDVISWFTAEEFDFIALYFNEPDFTSHKLGPNHAQIDNVILPKIDRTISYLLQKIEQYGLEDDLNVIIASDHGMAEVDVTVEKEDAISISNYIDESDILFQFAYHPLGVIEPKPEKLEKVYEQLKGAHPHMQVYYKNDMPERFHYRDNDRIPSIILSADLGYTIHQVFPGFHVNAGDHGYDNNYPDMRGCLYAFGPSFKVNYTIPGLESIHMYELMCHLLGLTPAPNNGSLEVLRPTLKEDKSRSLSISIMLITLITALIYRMNKMS